MAKHGEEMEPCFGRLTYVTEEEKLTQIISISKRKFIIGRAKDCDLSLNNRMVSGHHCYLEALESGQVYLHDTSSNGTLLNKNRITHGQKQLLNTGDKFQIVFKNGSEAVDFIFSASTDCDNQEEEDEDANSLNNTEEYAFESPEHVADVAAALKSKSQNKDCDTDATKTNHPTVHAGKSAKEGASNNETDEIEDHLICSICQDILYKPLSLQPCMHCFCSGCYSDWMTLSQKCPQCRLKVKRVGPNHIVGNLVEAYLKLYPEKQRDEDDIRELEAKNKITHDMLYPKKLIHKHSSGSETSDDNLSSEENNPPRVPSFRQRRAFVPYRKVCRQCPENPDVPPAKQLKTASSVDTSSGSQPSTSTKSTETTYTCKKTTRHVHCSCCFEFMPDRSLDRTRDPSIPPQNCDLCIVPASYYCNMYWGCKATACTGCLAPLRNIVFPENCLDNIINGNTYESNVLKGYLKSRKMGWKEIFTQCIAKLDAGAYTISVNKIRKLPSHQQPQPVVSSQTPVCKFCACQCFAQLAYQFRADISGEDLEDEVTGREDCYWGQNCRSQIKYHHAKNFNHICEQTRFK